MCWWGSEVIPLNPSMIPSTNRGKKECHFGVGWFLYPNIKFLEDSELYGKSTVSFTPCLSGSTPVSSPYTLYLVYSLKFCKWYIGKVLTLSSEDFKLWKILSYTANLQFPSHPAWVEVLLFFCRIFSLVYFISLIFMNVCLYSLCCRGIKSSIN